MKTKFYIITICLVAIFSLISCNNDNSGDTTKPVIELIEPEEGVALRIGSEAGVHFEMDLSDNEMLASYKVEIHNNFDNHGHDLRSGDETVPFTFERSWDVSGKNKHVHHHEIQIPANATPGNYHLMVYCADAAGNETHVARNIVLSPDAEEDD